jgi:branched-chain amino acid transport system ATP-binding protein
VTALIEARGLRCGYGSDIVIVPELELEVHPGEVVALLGANGAGKTTTILTLAGALPALGGEIFWNGELTKSPLHWRARNGLALVTEERAVLTKLTVAENFRVCGCDRDRALELFPELSEHLSRKVGLLSGGQQQMLALAWALARPTTTVLLADELSLGLAPLVVERLLRVVRQAADSGVGVLLVEQHVHKAMTVADRAYVLQRGRVQVEGTVEDLRDRVDEIQASYLSVGDEGQAINAT